MSTIFQDFMPDIFLIKTKAFDTSSTTAHKVFYVIVLPSPHKDKSLSLKTVHLSLTNDYFIVRELSLVGT